MKKSLLALAVLGAFAGAASAQSSVTIYGLLDMAVSKGNGGTAANVGANGLSEAWQVRQSAASRLGFRGNEDLGGGLSAQFQIEHRFTPDTGVASNPFWFGRSYVQLSSASFGRIYMGREYTPAFWIQSKSDPFGNDGVGQFGTAFSFAGLLFGTNLGGTLAEPGSRTSNTVGYKTPGNLGGFSGEFAVAAGENVIPRVTSGNIEYAAGPLYAGFSYSQLDGMDASLGDGNTLWNAAVHWDFGFIKPRLYYAEAEILGGTVKNQVMQIMASAPIGGGTFKVGYGKLESDLPNSDLEKFGIGFDYPLSKRTGVYADFGMGTQDNRSDNKAWAAGVKHTF